MSCLTILLRHKMALTLFMIFFKKILKGEITLFLFFVFEPSHVQNVLVFFTNFRLVVLIKFVFIKKV